MAAAAARRARAAAGARQARERAPARRRAATPSAAPLPPRAPRRRLQSPAGAAARVRGAARRARASGRVALSFAVVQKNLQTDAIARQYRVVDAQNQQLAETAAGLSSALAVRNVAVKQVPPDRLARRAVHHGAPGHARDPREALVASGARHGGGSGAGGRRRGARAGPLGEPDAARGRRASHARRARAPAAGRLRDRLPGHRRQGDRPHLRRRPPRRHRPRPADPRRSRCRPIAAPSSTATAPSSPWLSAAKTVYATPYMLDDPRDGRQGARRGAEAQVAPRLSRHRRSEERLRLRRPAGRPDSSPTRRPRSACRASPATSKRSAPTR